MTKFNYEIIKDCRIIKKENNTKKADEFYTLMRKVCKKSPLKSILELRTNFDEERTIKREIFNPEI